MGRVHRFLLFLTPFLTVAIIITNCNADTTAHYSMPELAGDNNAFALALYQQVSTGEENLILSPYSISAALAMTYAGARNNTEKQMSRVLHFNTDQELFHKQFSKLLDHVLTVSQKGTIELHNANSLWLQKGYNLKREFHNIIKDTYRSEIIDVNFANPEKPRVMINTWVEIQTKNKIRELIRPGFIDRLTRLVLVNAIYFKGDWENQFKASFTHKKPFYINEGDSVSVPVMFQEEKFIYLKDSLCQVIEMPYKGGELSMVILLPVKRGGLALLEKNFTGANLSKWTSNGIEQKVAVFLPRFAMASSFLLRETLAAMGMTDAFSDKADFSGITGKKDLKISEVIHKAYVKVDEKGSEAAAATAVVKRGLYMPELPVEFRADHPFIFLIRDNYSGSVLFLGKVIRPQE